MPKEKSQLTLTEKVRYFGQNVILRGLLGGLSLIPYRLRVPLLGQLMRGISPVVGYRKRIQDNLHLTCPDLSEAEIRKLCGNVADNVGRSLAEIYAGQKFWDRANAASIEGAGFSALEKARDAGRPVVLVTGHFGNYDAARSKLVQMGFNMGALYRRMANPYFNEHYVRAIEATGKPMFEQGKRGMVEMVRHLKKGGIIAIVADMHAQGGSYLPFFGQPALTSLVPAELALKYNAAFIPVYGIRDENGLDFKIIMGSEIPHSEPQTMTQALLDDLEALMKQYMGQWFWIHRRWKISHKQPLPEHFR